MRAVAKYMALVVALLLCSEVSAQKMKERGLVRQGNREFKREKFEKSVDSYQEALKHDPNSFEAKYDLASALYRTERYEKAEKTLQAIIDIFKLFKLTVKCWGRQCNTPFELFQILESVANSKLCLVGTYSDTLAAINASNRTDYRVSVMDTYRFGRATLQASRTAFTLFDVKRHRMLVICLHCAPR